MALWTAWFWYYCLGKTIDLALFVVFLFEELLVLLKTLVEPSMIYVSAVAVEIFYDHHTGGVCRKSCQTLIPILLDCPLVLVHTLL